MKRRAWTMAAAGAAALLVVSAALAGPVTGSTPRSTAYAAMKQYVSNQVRNMKNYPDASYRLGSCKRLFAHPWLAWQCGYRLNFDGVHTRCLTITFGIKRLTATTYRSTVRGAGVCSPDG